MAPLGEVIRFPSHDGPLLQSVEIKIISRQTRRLAAFDRHSQLKTKVCKIPGFFIETIVNLTKCWNYQPNRILECYIMNLCKLRTKNLVDENILF
jgi:hypothetical protein